MKTAILRTVIYADIFDYPLTKEEAEYWLIQSKKQDTKLIKEKYGYYVLKGRENIISIRLQRERCLKEKIKIAKKITNILKYIPAIRLVGITGGLAMNNADKDDDIDLFIITQRNALWTTRFITTLILDILGVRRRPNQKKIKNKVCLNMFMDESHLKIPKTEQDLYTAHEVLQMKPLWEKDDIYQKFLEENEWVKKYLPNAFPKSIKYQKLSIKYKNNIFLHSVELLLKKLQLWYMRNRRTTEVIKKGFVRFHPQDARVWVMGKYKESLKDYLRL